MESPSEKMAAIGAEIRKFKRFLDGFGLRLSSIEVDGDNTMRELAMLIVDSAPPGSKVISIKIHHSGVSLGEAAFTGRAVPWESAARPPALSPENESSERKRLVDHVSEYFDIRPSEARDWIQERESLQENVSR